MLNIKSYLKEREKYGIKKRPSGDEWIDTIKASSQKEETFFVTLEGYCSGSNSQCSKEIAPLLNNYHIAGIFDLSAPFIGTGGKFVLIHLVPQPIQTIKMGIYNGEAFERRKQKFNAADCPFKTADEYSPQFEKYINYLEQWIDTDNTPKIDDTMFSVCEFNTVKMSEIDFARLDPKYYTRKNMAVRDLVRKENFIRLADVAEIFSPHFTGKKKTEETAKILHRADFTYPLDINSLREGSPTNLILQKGDIVFGNVYGDSPSVYLYNIESKIPVHAGPHELVIRCRNIRPEYLFFYLNNDISQALYSMLHSGAILKRISKKDLEEFPITKPLFEDEKYIQDFALLTNLENKNYQNYTQQNKLREYYKKLRNIAQDQERPEHIEDIINLETAQNIKANDEQQLRSFLTDDLTELNTCFAHGAYKATLILAGSILEAVLIDWVSELHGKNYFEEPYMTFDNKTGAARYASLYDYINEIREIEHPDWMEEADKAHEIRKKRNLVHAKLCMKSDEINEITCRQVIGYLQDVLKTRGVNSP